jgi:ATP-dependent DNA helicase RecQ
MKTIAFVDCEVLKSGSVGDYGCIKDTGSTFHAKSAEGLRRFLTGTNFLCGHNLLDHDSHYLSDIIQQCRIDSYHFIDTLYLSPLLFPRRPYHALLKNEKLQTDELNNPLNDAIKARDLLNDEIAAFNKLDEPMKRIYFLLLQDQKEFHGFFQYLDYQTSDDLLQLIHFAFSQDICQQTDLAKLIRDNPIELAYCLSNIYVHDQFSVLPAWVLMRFPETERLMRLLRDTPCLSGCVYCDQALDPHRGLKYFFGYDAYRTFGGQPLQEMAVRDALQGKSVLAIFPTGGGKSITFQVPALMSGKNVKGLTVVISPLQSLMKDQVDNLERAGITEAATINGLIDPIERAEVIERVRDGSVSILYISPELLRSKTIESLLLGRRISRFVIDEAHCFSAWGQDFRVDYLYIATFIKALQTKKNLSEPIPVSCFTATAKPSVVENIRSYFKSKLDLDLIIHQTNVPRTNLLYKVFVLDNDDEKYQELRRLLEAKRCPTIIYTTKTHTTEMLAERLTRDGYPASAYHGQMDRRIKTANQDYFLAGEVSIMVATSAFGMGVDKKDVGLVIHYQISNSLEQYLQEAGRAGRDENIKADCYVLFSEQDLDNLFVLLNQTRINIKEIQLVWRAIKELTRFRRTVSQSALEIARKAGWDDSINTIETNVMTAIATLEEAGYIRRLQNMPRVFADSILCRNVMEANEIINNSAEFTADEKFMLFAS